MTADSRETDEHLKRLESLIQQVPAILECLPTDDSFLAWREACLEGLKAALGVDNNLVREFERLRFRIHPELLERKSIELSRAVGAHARVDDREFFRERVHEAQEVLVTARVTLRHGPGDLPLGPYEGRAASGDILLLCEPHTLSC